MDEDGEPDEGSQRDLWEILFLGHFLRLMVLFFVSVEFPSLSRLVDSLFLSFEANSRMQSIFGLVIVSVETLYRKRISLLEIL